jgi:hypothetical protein
MQRNRAEQAVEVTSIVGYERADGSLGQMFIGATDNPLAYAQAVRMAVEDARADGGRHIVVQLIEQPSGRIISALYAREERV